MFMPIYLKDRDINLQFSHRQNIRDGHHDFAVTGDLWPALLYPHAKGDPEEAGEGLFKSALLIKVFSFSILKNYVQCVLLDI